MSVIEQPPAAVILAAGKGTRMKSEHPKVAVRLAGRALLNHVLDHLLDAGVRRQVIVVGYRHEEVRALAPAADRAQISFAMQEEQHGTGHAFLCAREALGDFAGPVLCTAGDMPMVRAASFAALLAFHRQNQNQVSVLSARMENPTGYGRIVRNEQGELIGNVEEKDADAQTKTIKEVNTGVYVFNAPQVFDWITRIGRGNAQNEYYLPDVIAVARKQGGRVGALRLEDSGEAQGVNSPEDLAILEEKLRKAG